MRGSLIALLSTLLIPSAGTASTIVARYDATSIVSVSIAAAYFETTGLDAMGEISPGFYNEQYDSGTTISGAGQAGFMPGAPLSSDPASFTAAYFASGYADSTSNSASSSGAGGYVLPTYNYGPTNCAAVENNDCNSFDPVILEIAYHVETSESVDILDPLTGSATATAEARLSMNYSESGYAPVHGATPMLSLNASGNQLHSGIFSTRLEPGSALVMFLYASYAGGSATYVPSPVTTGPLGAEPLPAVPLPSAVPLMLSGLAALGLLARRRGRA
jgi:hypothetical protein